MDQGNVYQPFPMDAYLPIEDYALIGDLYTAALVGKNGSIDWCCLPRFDSPSVFAALLDRHKGGSFSIEPDRHPTMKRKQLYLPSTNVLLTRFLSMSGIAEITDFMLVKAANSDLYQHHFFRSVSVTRGTLSFTLNCQPAFQYAQDAHHLVITEHGCIFKHHDFHLLLTAPFVLQRNEQGGVRARFTLQEDQTLHFLFTSTRDRHAMPQSLTDEDYERAFQSTLAYWRTWISQCRYRGRWRDMVERSALVLKLLTYAPTGAIIAAPTTSLPEAPKGQRNWDYRYTWLRDTSFTLNSLLSLGFTQEAETFMNWLDARCHELQTNGTLQPMYGIDGKHDLTEKVLSHLEGYSHSQPVRIGNGAYRQKQLDIYGEFLDAISIYNQYNIISYDLWKNILRLLDWLAQHWQDPDEGIWEVRGSRKHFLHSRLMSWVAFDRALRMAYQRGWPAPVSEWWSVRTQIYQQIMEQGWNEERQCFTQYYGGTAVDASILLMPIVHFTGMKEPRMIATINRVQQELAEGAFVRRYDPEHSANDGFCSPEGTFGACSFWLVDNLARAGRVEEARLLLEKLFSYSSSVGLYAEEMNPMGEALGNYPQAFTHLALITACLTLDNALDRKQLL